MELSIFLAKVLGLYMVIVSLAVLYNRKRLPALVQEFNASRGIILTTGVFTLLLGLAIVVSHNIWEVSWVGLITLLGWLTVFKGVVRLFFFDKLGSWGEKIIHSNWYFALIVVFLILGIGLARYGFTY